MTVMNLAKKEIAMAAERELWFIENAEVCFAAVLLACGPPPQQYAADFDHPANKPETRAWVNYKTRAWQMLWDQVPLKYKTNYDHYCAGSSRQRQSREFWDEYIRWLNTYLEDWNGYAGNHRDETTRAMALREH